MTALNSGLTRKEEASLFALPFENAAEGLERPMKAAALQRRCQDEVALPLFVPTM